jgi:glycosyltransferase involved in cell wall biosynthesis
MLLRRDGSQCDPRQNHAQCYNRYDFWGNVPYRLAIFKALTSNVRLFLSPSQAVIDRHIEAGFARARFRLLRLGFPETPLLDPTHTGVRAVIDSAPHYRTILYAGGGVDIKGANVLLRAIPAVLARLERTRFVIAGGGEPQTLDQLRAFGPAVQVLGWVPFEEMSALYAISDLALAPSIWHENSPVVIFQSFQAGVPVVGSRIGGIPEFIRDGETGYLSPPGDAQELAAKIIAHFEQPPIQQRRMRARCVQDIRTRLMYEQHVKDTVQIYHEVLDH